VVERPKPFRLEHLADNPAVLDGEIEPVAIEVGADGGLSHPGGEGHGRDHGPVQTELQLCTGEPFGPLDLFGDVDRLVEGRAEQADRRR
jgi:hypothetical protein